MTMRSFLSLPLLASMLSLEPAQAVECAFRALDPGSQVVRDSGEARIPAQWLTDFDCEKLRVSVGRVRVVYRDADGIVAKKDVVPRARLAVQGSGSTSPVLDEIRSLLAGDERARAGRSRSGSADFETVEAALPHGKVVRPEGATLEIPLPLVADETGGSFVLARDRAQVYQTRVTGKVLAIPKAVLTTGGMYEWTFKTATDAAKGSFTLVDAGATAALPTDAALNGKDPTLARATALLQGGYVLEARQSLREWIDQ